MHTTDASPWQHDHQFGTEEPSRGESRIRWVVALTAVMMVAEIVAGTVFGSMALLADGWHMGTHAVALGIALFAYAYARRHAASARFSFGTGKVTSLGGFASATGLAVVAVFVLIESVGHLITPVSIEFDQAIAVAVVGLVVNVVSAALLHDSEHDHDHDDHHHDHNLRGAYLHVLADALTSVLAIAALVAGKYAGWVWLDPFMGIVGAIIIGRWSLGLLRDTSNVLLDAEVSPQRRAQLAKAIETNGSGDRLVDLHLWRVGPKHLAAIVSVVTDQPREPEYYKDRIEQFTDIAHVTVEVNRCQAHCPSVIGSHIVTD